MKLYVKSNQYLYVGSVADRYGNILIRNREFFTQAPTVEKAQSNILSQAKTRLGLKQSAYLKLTRPEAVEEFNANATISHCPNCGIRLTDSGYCPRCYTEGYEDSFK